MLHHSQNWRSEECANSPWWSMVTSGGWLCILSLTLAEYFEHLRISTAVHSVQQEFWKANETQCEFNKYAHFDAYANSFQQNVLLKDLLRVLKKRLPSFPEVLLVQRLLSYFLNYLQLNSEWGWSNKNVKFCHTYLTAW